MKLNMKHEDEIRNMKTKYQTQNKKREDEI
jgi:hypothetical protein